MYPFRLCGNRDRKDMLPLSADRLEQMEEPIEDQSQVQKNRKNLGYTTAPIPKLNLAIEIALRGSKPSNRSRRFGPIGACSTPGPYIDGHAC